MEDIAVSLAKASSTTQTTNKSYSNHPKYQFNKLYYISERVVAKATTTTAAV